MPPRQWSATTYDVLSLPHQRWGRRITDELRLVGDETVLDAGCGTGRDTQTHLDRLPHGHVIAVDGSTAMLDQLHARLTDHPHAGPAARPARRTPKQAREHIVGYTVFNDWSARDLQSAEMKVGLGPCKGKDTATTLGPWLVTADEVEPYRDGVALTAWVNGAVVGRDLLSNMGWTFEDLVAYASRGTVVRPGDVLGSGTMGNGGCLAELWGLNGDQQPAPLKVGDIVELTVEGIGTVANTVVPGVEPQPIPVARPRPRTRP